MFILLYIFILFNVANVIKADIYLEILAKTVCPLVVLCLLSPTNLDYYCNGIEFIVIRFYCFFNYSAQLDILAVHIFCATLCYFTQKHLGGLSSFWGKHVKNYLFVQKITNFCLKMGIEWENEFILYPNLT